MEEALFSGISSTRLLIRLAVEAFLLIVALIHIRRATQFKEEISYWPQTPDDELWQGSPYSADKGKRLLFFSLKLAMALRLSKRNQDKLRRLCYCYDMGLFEATGKNKTVGEHIELGAEIAAHFKMLQDLVPLILAHEEYYNGSGYYCLAGERIPVQCRILQVVLMFDNLHEGIDSRQRLPYGLALQELGYYAGTMLDPELVALFQKLMRHMPLLHDQAAQTAGHYV
jgi:response regulator RpfG family c-di-GMP phosphodiesterase